MQFHQYGPDDPNPENDPQPRQPEAGVEIRYGFVPLAPDLIRSRHAAHAALRGMHKAVAGQNQVAEVTEDFGSGLFFG